MEYEGEQEAFDRAVSRDAPAKADQRSVWEVMIFNNALPEDLLPTA